MTDQHPIQAARVFRIGATRIIEDLSMAAFDNNGNIAHFRGFWLECA